MTFFLILNTTSAVHRRKTPFYCTNSPDPRFHLKNKEQNTCMGIKDGTETLLIRRTCDNSSALQWRKDPIPQHSESDGATRFCHSNGDNCLGVNWKFLTGEYHIAINPYAQMKRNQQWKVKYDAGKLINVESQSCLTSYFNSKILSNKSNKKLYGMETCSNSKKNTIAEQKWLLLLLPKCYNNILPQ